MKKANTIYTSFASLRAYKDSLTRAQKQREQKWIDQYMMPVMRFAADQYFIWELGLYWLDEKQYKNSHKRTKKNTDLKTYPCVVYLGD